MSIKELLAKVEAEHPYDKYQNYSLYNEGWSDAISRIEQLLQDVKVEVDYDG